METGIMAIIGLGAAILLMVIGLLSIGFSLYRKSNEEDEA
jgi:hypothetical protein